ncbi:MAG: hypothetical protein QGG01_10405, partial [Roseibacillus sp.]|nr:hypothetical protein [Roseibacillus sp.]
MQHPYTLVLLFTLAAVLVPLTPAGGAADRKGESSAEQPAEESVPAKTEKNTASKTKPTEGGQDGRKKRTPKKPITPPDYGQWEQLSMGNRKASHDGRWLVFDIRRVDEKSSLHLHRIRGGKSQEEEVFPQGERPVFSNDSHWLAVTMGRSPEEKKKAKASKAPPPPGATVKLRSLADGETTEFKNVGTVIFSDDSRFAAIEVIGKAAPPRPGSPPPQPAKALLVRNLATGDDTTFGNVTRFAWSRQGALLALVVDSPSISNSLQLFNPEKETLRTLESSDQDYVGLLWRKDSFDLGAARQMKYVDKEDISHALLSFRDLDGPATPASGRSVYDHRKDSSFPPDHYL